MGYSDEETAEARGKMSWMDLDSNSTSPWFWHGAQLCIYHEYLKKQLFLGIHWADLDIVTYNLVVLHTAVEFKY